MVLGWVVGVGVGNLVGWWVGVGTPVGGCPSSLPRLAGSLARVSGGVASQCSPDTGAAGSTSRPDTNTTTLSSSPKGGQDRVWTEEGWQEWKDPRALVGWL